MSSLIFDMVLQRNVHVYRLSVIAFALKTKHKTKYEKE